MTEEERQVYIAKHLIKPTPRKKGDTFVMGPDYQCVVQKALSRVGAVIMNACTESCIRALNEAGLILLYHDVVNRIGPHVIGVSPDVYYIQNQEAILNVVQNELFRISPGKINTLQYYYRMGEFL